MRVVDECLPPWATRSSTITCAPHPASLRARLRRRLWAWQREMDCRIAGFPLLLVGAALTLIGVLSRRWLVGALGQGWVGSGLESTEVCSPDGACALVGAAATQIGVLESVAIPMAQLTLWLGLASGLALLSIVAIERVRHSQLAQTLIAMSCGTLLLLSVIAAFGAASHPSLQLGWSPLITCLGAALGVAGVALPLLSQRAGRAPDPETGSAASAVALDGRTGASAT